MSTAPVSLSPPAPSLTWPWLLANLFVALVNLWPFLLFVYGFLDPNTVQPTITLAFAVTSWVLPAILFAILTAPILKRKLPSFQMRDWIRLHAGIGLILGTAAGVIVAVYLGIGSPGQGLLSFVNWLLHTDVFSYALTDSASFRKLFIIGGVPIIASPIVGALTGAIVGSIQALVLRRTARGLVAWIGLSALAAASGSVVGALNLVEKWFALLDQLSPQVARDGYRHIDEYTWIYDLMSQGAAYGLPVAPTITAALIMLAAIHRLQPR
jgi:hypothetical protein